MCSWEPTHRPGRGTRTGRPAERGAAPGASGAPILGFRVSICARAAELRHFQARFCCSAAFSPFSFFSKKRSVNKFCFNLGDPAPQTATFTHQLGEGGQDAPVSGPGKSRGQKFSVARFPGSGEKHGFSPKQKKPVGPPTENVFFTPITRAGGFGKQGLNPSHKYINHLRPPGRRCFFWGKKNPKKQRGEVYQFRPAAGEIFQPAPSSLHPTPCTLQYGFS